MSEFQFVKSQRVIVPAETAGAEGIQAVITAATGFLGREPEYKLQWPASDLIDERGRLVPCFAAVPESVLIKAQPPQMVTAEEATRLRNQAYLDGMADLNNEHAAERASRAAKRKAQRAAKSRKRR